MSYKLRTVSVEQIAGFPFPQKPCNYIYSTASGIQRGLIYNTNEETFKKIKKILIGNEKHNTIRKGERVYVMPGHSLPKDRIKEFLRQNDAYLTDDISKATAIAGSNASAVRSGYSDQIITTAVLMEIRECIMIKNEYPEEFDAAFALYPDAEELKADYRANKPCVVSCNVNKKNANNQTHYDKYFIAAKGMEVLYYVLTKKLPVFTEEFFLENANSTVKLEDPEVFKSIMGMLDSKDPANEDMGVELLINADLTGECRYHLWKLAQKHYYKLNNRTRSKNVRAFTEMTEWTDLYSKSSETLLLEIVNNNPDPKSVAILADIVLKDKVQQLTRNVDAKYFDMISDGPNITITVKPEWIARIKEEAYETA